jgi:16S rRNA G966 N2-methylase RsmD
MSDTTSGARTTYSAAIPTLLQSGKEQDIPLDQIIVPSISKRSIDPDIVAGLMYSICEIGLLTPIVVTQDYVLVTGHHRLAAARKLRMKTIRVRIVATDALRNELVTIDENLVRKELSILEQADHLKRREEILLALGMRSCSGENQYSTTTSGEYVTGGTSQSGGAYHRPPESVTGKLTTKDLAKSSGFAESTYQERLKISRAIPEEVKEKIRNTEIAGNKSDLLRLIKVKDQDDQMKIVQKVLNGDVKTIKEGVTKVQRDKQYTEFNALAEDMKKLPDTISLVHADFFDYEEQIEDNSIDMILTDPPYISDFAQDIPPFMTIANRILKPGGALVMYLGHARLREFFDGIRECEIEFGDEALQYYHVCALEHTGNLGAMHHVGAMNGFKPILIAMKKPIHKPYQMYNDLLKGSGREKDAHDWQQSYMEILPLVNAFSKPGSTILDPFCGSGSIGLAAKSCNRKFVGIDIDTKNVQIARARILKMECREDGGGK